VDAVNDDISLGYDSFNKSNSDLDNIHNERYGYSLQYAIAIIRIQ